jgi:2-polyprenyl-3-methyl-5-hydroxy-6-metoxy-1,4-benzoquinol methylase
MSRTDHLYMPKDHMDKLYHSSNPIVRFVHNKRLWAITNQIPKYGCLKILDAGCGEGHLLSELHKYRPMHKFYGFDVSSDALIQAKKRCAFASITKTDISSIREKKESFDVVICSEVLEHIYEYGPVLSELQRILKKNGLLILTFPNETMWTIGRIFLLRRPIKVPDHVNSFNPEMIKKIVLLKIVKELNMPFDLPLIPTLGYMIVFKK